jgi:hypothetical protein
MEEEEGEEEIMIMMHLNWIIYYVFPVLSGFNT